MSTPTRRQVKGAAGGHVRTLSDPTAPPESRRRAAVQLRKMGFYELVEEHGEVFDKETKPVTLQSLGREAVTGHLEKDRFSIDKRIVLHQPHSPSLTTGTEVAAWLDHHKKPDERARLLVATPRITRVQLGTDVGTRLDALADSLQTSKPPFDVIPFHGSSTLTARTMEIAGRPLTVVRRIEEVGRFARRVLMTDDAGKPALHAQVAQLHEHSYTAVDQEWANNYLGDVATASGELAVGRLLEAGDPEIAVPVGGAVWMNQQIRPLQPL